MNMQTPPDDWFRVACEVVPHGVACISSDHKFIWTNHHYCKLAGYSQMELVGRTWMSITADADIGGDLKSVEDLLTNPLRTSYTLNKHYIHKNGTLVPVTLFVHVYKHGDNCFLFIACADHIMTTVEAVKKIEIHTMQEMEKLRVRLRAIEQSRETNAKILLYLRTYWPIITGTITLIGTIIWHLARRI